MEPTLCKNHIPPSCTRRQVICSCAQDGFTLIEVVLTIALLALVLGLVMPRIGSNPSLSESSRHLIAAIQSLYTAAVASNRTYHLNIDLDRQIYWATVVTSDGDRPPTERSLAFRAALPSSIKIEDVTTGRQAKATAGNVSIEFFPGGRVAQTVIHLSNPDRIIAMVLNPLTGAVRVFDHYYVEPSKESLSEEYRDFFKALPLPPVLPVQQMQQARQIEQAQQAVQP